MEFLGIGLPELGLILVVILLVLGPKDMAGTARRIARTIRTLSQSEFWRTTREAWKMAQEIPAELMRESGLDEARAELDKMGKDLNQWKREVDTSLPPGDNRILPPVGQAANPASQVQPQPQDPAAEPADPVTLETDPSDATPNPAPRTDE